MPSPVGILAVGELRDVEIHIGVIESYAHFMFKHAVEVGQIHQHAGAVIADRSRGTVIAHQFDAGVAVVVGACAEAECFLVFRVTPFRSPG